MTIEQQIDSDIPIDLKPKPKFRTSKSNYGYIRNNEVECEWKCKNEERGEIMDYVLVSQGMEIYRTKDKQEAEQMMNESNEEWYKYCQWCYDNDESPVDNEVFMYEEE